MRVPHELRSDLSRRLYEWARPDGQYFVNKVALPRSRAKQPQQPAAEKHHPGDFDKPAENADRDDLKWHGGRDCSDAAPEALSLKMDSGSRPE